MGKKSAAESTVCRPGMPADLPFNPAPHGLPRASLKELRKAAGLTQDDLAATLCVGQDTISRLEKRSDLLLSTLRHYIESIGGELSLVATFPDRPAVVIDHLGDATPGADKHGRHHVTAHGEP
ncbi:MAG: helix-turn-helix domain-containing protein [Zoogloeaceae bacterium]|nr:helix-turn-helix domain-containing protein [Zoogloeaceae bacterium]